MVMTGTALGSYSGRVQGQENVMQFVIHTISIYMKCAISLIGALWALLCCHFEFNLNPIEFPNMP